MVVRAYQHELNSSRVAVGKPLLDIDNISLRFGGVAALSEVSLTVRQGTIHAIIGPNGAGKSSLLNCISGLYHPQDGSITLHTADPDGPDGTGRDGTGFDDTGFDDTGRTHNLTKLSPHRIARLGVARSFQNIELFTHLTVLDNLMLGRHIHMKHRLFPSMLWFGPARRQEIKHRALVEEVIDLLRLQAYRHQPVGSLAYGIQKRVELGRALCIQPGVLLLDEPMAGMNSEEKEDMARYILDVHELAGVTVVLIEHDMNVVMDISAKVSVLDFGKLIADDVPENVEAHPAVIDAYLGVEEMV